MNQKKIGAFLKRLRTEKGLTQEQLAEHFNVSNRTVSRWETGSNMPDLGMIFELAEFYDVDLKEITSGERKSETMNLQDKETLNLISDYAENKKYVLVRRMRYFFLTGCIAMIFGMLLEFTRDADIWTNRDFLYGLLSGVSDGTAFGALLIGVIYLSSILLKNDKRKSSGGTQL